MSWVNRLFGWFPPEQRAQKVNGRQIELCHETHLFRISSLYRAICPTIRSEGQFPALSISRTDWGSQSAIISSPDALAILSIEGKYDLDERVFGPFAYGRR